MQIGKTWRRVPDVARHRLARPQAVWRETCCGAVVQHDAAIGVLRTARPDIAIGAVLAHHTARVISGHDPL